VFVGDAVLVLEPFIESVWLGDAVVVFELDIDPVLVFDVLIVLVLLVEPVIVFETRELLDDTGDKLDVLDACPVVVAAFVRAGVLVCNRLDVCILDLRGVIDRREDRVDVLDAVAENVGMICTFTRFLAVYSCNTSHFSGGLAAMRPIIDNNKIQRLPYYSIC
jgi:hypothetical protein